jgi:Glucose-repressible protein Grg1
VNEIYDELGRARPACLGGIYKPLLFPNPSSFFITQQLKTYQTHTQKINPNKLSINQHGDHQGKLLPLPSSKSLSSSSLPSHFLMLTYCSQNAANYVSESVQGAGATASKEANKQVAKDNDASLGSRATAAKDAVGDKFDEQSHNTKADVHKGKQHHSEPS